LTHPVGRGGYRNISHDATGRDRLVALKKAKKGLITQRQAAGELGQSERHIRRLLKRLKGNGDGVLVHALRGRQPNRKLDEKLKQKALKILTRDVYSGFGPTLAAEYLASRHQIRVGRETVRKWMMEGKLWRAGSQSCPASLSQIRYLMYSV
jgi:transposase